MSNVNKLQQQLLTDIFERKANSDFDQKGLAVYQRNLQASALRALKVSFPTVSNLIGNDLMKVATELLLQLSPPSHGDWAQWGESLSDILQNMSALEAFPYVPDCARLDFIVHQLYRAADNKVDLSTLKFLQEYPADLLAIELNPGLQTIGSKYPLAEIWRAHQYKGEERQQLLIQAAEKLISEQHYFILVSRTGNQVEVSNLDEQEFRWINCLRQGPISEALASAEHTTFSLEQWLTVAVNKDWIQQVKKLPKYLNS